MELIYAPTNWSPDQHGYGISVFLAGSIEMGAAEEWQDKVASALSEEDVLVFNPRRKDWDSSWVQSIDNPQFNEQVNWELNHIDAANIVMFYFDPNTKSPITLMELGIASQNPGKQIFVCCEEPFWRKGNVDILCHRSDITMCSSLDDMISSVKKIVTDYNGG